MANDMTRYADLLGEIKSRISRAQTRAALSANREMLALYWDIGRLITERREAEGWRAGVLKKLSQDLKNELPETRGFSERNLKLMTRFYREYPVRPISPTALAKLDLRDRTSKDDSTSDIGSKTIEGKSPKVQTLFALLPWSHNVLLMQSVKDLRARAWYMQQALDSGWSYNVLHQMIKTKAHLRQGAAITNFRETLPPPQSDLARQALKDPFIFDFLTLDTTFREQELEAGLLGNLQRFLLELGKGFAFVGRQYPIRPYSRLARRTEIGTADHRGDRANTWPAQ